MRIRWAWVAIGTLVMIGGIWFASRSAMALELSVESSWTVIAAFAIGAVMAGALIARHAVVQPWREPLISAILAMTVFAVLGRFSRDADNSMAGPTADMSSIMIVLGAVVVMVAAVGGGWFGRRFVAREPSTGSLLVLGGLVTSGTVMTVIGTVAAICGTHRFEGGWFALVVLGTVALGGFITQAAVSVRRPWVCGGGALILLLLFLQESGTRDISATLLGTGVVALIDVAGAAIAARVFRARWADARVAMPEAHVR